MSYMERTAASLGSSTPPSLLEERLKYLVESCQEWWTYAIFWQAFNDNHNNLYLSFGDCYFRGLNNFQQTSQLLLSGSELMTASAARSFVLGEDIIGSTFGTDSFMWLAGDDALQMHGSHRAKEVNLHGIKTLVCVATCWGVVEFGSLDVLKEDWGLVSLIKPLFGLESDATIKENCLHQIQSFAQQDLQSGPSASAREDKPRKKREKSSKNVITDHINHANLKDMERQRREKLNQRFYALRSVVPYVSKMDKASLLADAVTYIGELKSNVETLTKKVESLHLINVDHKHLSTDSMVTDQSQVEVNIVGSQAVIRVQSLEVNHPAARLMDAMKNLGMRVHHVSAANISNMMIQDVIASIPEGFPNDEEVLKSIILKNL